MNMPQRPPDWQLPAGVTPGLWEYLHDPTLAQEYLEKVSDSPFAHADQAFVAQQLPAPCRVIDLGCGPGRSLLPLFQRGFSCTGVDLSENMLEQARKLIAAHGSASSDSGTSSIPSGSIELVQANLGEPLPFASHTFDAALCLFGTLGMLHPESVRQDFLGEVRRILKPGGQFLLHVHNSWPILGVRTLIARDSVVILPAHQGISNLQMKLYNLQEIRKVLASAGFAIHTMDYVHAGQSSGKYTGPRWIAPFRADGFLLAVQPRS